MIYFTDGIGRRISPDLNAEDAGEWLKGYELKERKKRPNLNTSFVDKFYGSVYTYSQLFVRVCISFILGATTMIVLLILKKMCQQ